MPRHPNQNPVGYRNPGEKQLNYVEVDIQSEDGVRLKGWLILSERPTANPTIIYYQ
jgi:hypothetical protein